MPVYINSQDPREITMQIETLQYREGHGWSIPLPIQLDSENTAVIFFAAPNQREAGQLHELCESFPNSHIIGCSTAGEIHGGELFFRRPVLTSGAGILARTSALSARWLVG